MATNAPKSRKTHVIRIFGTNKKKEVLHEIWADVERIDQSRSVDVLQGARQKLVRKLRWRDDPADTEEYLDPDLEDRLPQSGPLAPKRKTVLVKVCDPDSDDLTDPEEWIPIRALEKIRSKSSSQTVGQLQYENLINDDLVHSRVVEPRRIVHCDTNIDEDVENAIADDPNLKAYVVKGENYTKDTETKDKDQWIEHEIITKVIHKGNSVYYSNGGGSNNPGPNSGQVRKTKFLNQYLIDESEPAKLEKLGKNDFNPPYRLDPYQNIININLSQSQAAVLGTVPAPRVTNDFSDSSTETTRNGTEWDSDKFGAGTSNAASGFGRTVVCAANRFIAFGKPTEGDKCFIAVKGKTIQRGALNEQGELEWSDLGELPISLTDFSGAQSCSFAGGAFFISYLDDDTSSTETYLAVSFDGRSFSYGVQPFTGVVDVANGTDPSGFLGDPNPGPVGGLVIYDKKNKLYVTTGRYARSYVAQFASDNEEGQFDERFVDLNFMSSVSRDGVTWVPKFDISEGSGIHNNVSSETIWAPGQFASSVCFGKGKFVAATGYKTRHLFSIPPGVTFTYLARPVCGVATSTDGANWINQQLPGVISGLNAQGQINAVGFFKTGGVDEDGNPKGFFVAAGFESQQPPASIIQSKLWTSSDGTTWSPVRTDSGKYHWILSTINKNSGKTVYR